MDVFILAVCMSLYIYIYIILKVFVIYNQNIKPDICIPLYRYTYC